MSHSLLNCLSYSKLLKSMLRHPVTVIAVIAAITLFFALNLPRLSFSTSVYDFVIQDLPETARYEDFKKIFGSDEIIRVVVKGENIFEPATFQKVEQLAAAVSEIKGVRRVISLPDIKKSVDISGNWDLQKFAEILKPVALFRRNIISEDHKTTALTLLLKNGADEKSVIHEVSKLINDSTWLSLGRHSDTQTLRHLTAYQIGMPVVSQSLAEFTEKDFFQLPPITFLMIAGMLFLLFRNLPCLLLPILCVSLSLIWTLGLMALLNIPLSMLTMVVPIFLIAVGMAYCLYICAEYLQQARESDSRIDTVFSTFSEMALPTALAVFTTAAGLGSLLVNRITAIHDFALLSCFAILSLLIIVLTLFPAMLALLRRPASLFTLSPALQRWVSPTLQKISHFSLLTSHFSPALQRWVSPTLQKISHFSLLNVFIQLNLKYQHITFPAVGILVVFFGIGIFRLQAETNPVDYFRRDTPVSRHFHDIYQDLSGSFPVNVVMDGTVEDYFYREPEHIRQIARIQEFLETLPGVDKTVSFADYMKLVNYALNQFDPKYYALPEESFEVRMLINNYKTMLGEDMLSQFMSPDFSKANILLLTHISSSRDFLGIQEKILSHVRQQFPKNLMWDVTGFGMVISASSEILVTGQIKSFSLTLMLIFAVMFLLFLSSKVGLTALIPATFPIIIVFGLMGWTGIRLSVATSLIASIAVGLAIDDIIHYLVRYNREFKKDLDKDRALRDTVIGVGRPIIFTSLTISMGFSILIFSHFSPTAIFGFLMVVTMLLALAADLIILPSLMLHVELVTAWDILRLMPTLGGVSAGIAHELNQPLTVIKMGSDILKMMVQQEDDIPKEQLAQVVDEIGTQVERASEMIGRLTEFEGKPHFAKEKSNINKAVRDTLAIVSHQLQLDNIKINFFPDDRLPPVLAHNNRLAQVIFNLINNAAEAIKEKNSGEKENRVITIRTFQEGDRTGMTISDTGTGIPALLKDRIFEPFFTTKESGKGKGLGLSISNEIVRSYGGRIEIQSEEGKGTGVSVTFPLYER